MKEPKAPRKVIKVSSTHIATAIPSDSSHCMIADAIRDNVLDACNISVDIQTIRWSNRVKHERYIYLTPAKVQWAIVKFDEGIKPRAFSFAVNSGQVLPMRRDTGTRKGSYKKRIQGGRKPNLIGGKEPPNTFIGHHRVFGLKSLKVVPR